MRIPLLLLATLSTAACGPDVPFTPAQRLAGEWTCTMDGTRVHLHADGRWELILETEDGVSRTPGTFTATWSSITISSESGPCPGVDGRYTYELSRDTLLLTEARDDCPARETRFEYAWTRMLEPAIPEVQQGELEAAEADR